MGPMDGILNPVAREAGSSATLENLMQVVGQLVQQHGGIPGIISALNQAGLGQVVSSWVSPGANASVSGPQLGQALGSGAIEKIASHLGISFEQASAVLAQVLPHLVDHMTPGGQVPEGTMAQGDALSTALGALKTKLFS